MAGHEHVELWTRPKSRLSVVLSNNDRPRSGRVVPAFPWRFSSSRARGANGGRAATPLPPLPSSAAGSIFSEASSYYTSDGYASEFSDFEPPPPRELSSKERSDLLYRHRFVPLSKFALYRAPFGGRRHTIWGDDPVRLRARLEALEAEAKDGDLLAIQTFGEKRQARLAAYDVCPRRRNSFATLRGLEEKEMRPRLLRRRQQRKGLIRVLQGYYLDGVPQSADAEETGTEGAEFNTPTALLQRETLVFHPVIRTMLEKIWEVTDEDGSGGIELDEYLIIQRKLYCSLVENRYGQAEDAEGRKAWKKIALEDWDTDRRECEDIDKRKFFNSWFALVDIWTGDISAESYIAMLSTLFHSITTKDPDTQLIEFLDDEEIRPFDPDLPPKQFYCHRAAMQRADDAIKAAYHDTASCVPSSDSGPVAEGAVAVEAMSPFADAASSPAAPVPAQAPAKDIEAIMHEATKLPVYFCSCFSIDPDLREFRWRRAAEQDAEAERLAALAVAKSQSAQSAFGAFSWESGGVVKAEKDAEATKQAELRKRLTERPRAKKLASPVRKKLHSGFMRRGAGTRRMERLAQRYSPTATNVPSRPVAFGLPNNFVSPTSSEGYRGKEELEAGGVAGGMAVVAVTEAAAAATNATAAVAAVAAAAAAAAAATVGTEATAATTKVAPQLPLARAISWPDTHGIPVSNAALDRLRALRFATPGTANRHRIHAELAAQIRGVVRPALRPPTTAVMQSPPTLNATSSGVMAATAAVAAAESTTSSTLFLEPPDASQPSTAGSTVHQLFPGRARSPVAIMKSSHNGLVQDRSLLLTGLRESASRLNAALRGDGGVSPPPIEGRSLRMISPIQHAPVLGRHQHHGDTILSPSPVKAAVSLSHSRSVGGKSSQKGGFYVSLASPLQDDGGRAGKTSGCSYQSDGSGDNNFNFHGEDDHNREGRPLPLGRPPSLADFPMTASVRNSSAAIAVRAGRLLSVRLDQEELYNDGGAEMSEKMQKQLALTSPIAAGQADIRRLSINPW